MNNKSTKDERNLINTTLANKENGTLLSEDQNRQGIEYLLNQWKTPKGVERKNNPFGYMEQEALNTFEHFTLRELYNSGNANRNYYIPLYEVHAGNCGFIYHMNKGIINIVG